MDRGNPADAPPELPLDVAGLAEPETEVPPPRSGAVARVSVSILSEPDVVLDDPPAIFGGASHTW
jgi:hypothetical protein